MKKGLIRLIVIVVASVLLVGCGSGSHIPKGMSEKTYDCGVRALEIMEKYSDSEITKDVADTELDKIVKELYEESKSVDDEYMEMINAVTGYITVFNYGKTEEAEDFLRDELKK